MLFGSRLPRPFVLILPLICHLALPFSATAQPQLENLIFTSMCSFKPSIERRWRVRNPNNVDVPFTWQVFRTPQTGSGVALANSDVFFFTSTIGGANTTKIFFDNGRERTKASSGANCSLQLTSMCSDNPSVERRWRVRNSQYGEVDFDWQVVGTEQKGSASVEFGVDAFFTTEAVSGPNTTKVFYPENRDTTKASSGAQCAQYTTSPSCSDNSTARFTFSLSDGSLASSHDYRVVDDLGATVATGLIPAGYSSSDLPLLIEVAPTASVTLLTLEIPSLDLASVQPFDPCGVCGGEGSSCGFCGEDASGQPLFLDECGECGGDSTLCADCAGIPNGTSILDACGECGGSDDSCSDCAGTPNGLAVAGIDGQCCLDSERDRCGVCFGDGTTCLDCESADVSESLFVLDGEALRLRNLVQRAARRAKRLGVASSVIRKIRNEASDGYESAWTSVWSIPQIVDQCSNTEFCTAVSNEQALTNFSDSLDSLKRLIRRLVKRSRRASNRKRFGKKLLRRANEIIAGADTETEAVPSFASSCR